MIKVAIVEDEKEYSMQISEYLERYQKEKHIAIQCECFFNGMSFLENYDGRFDIVFMDIAMPYMNGLTAAKKLREKDSVVCLIFITTLSNYAIKGYEVDALDFLVKPVQYELFQIKLEKALFYTSRRANQTYTIVTATGMQKISVSDIHYIESVKHYLFFHTAAGEYKMRGAMKEIENAFLREGFCFINRSLLVNLSHVDAVKGDTITIHGENLPVARVYRTEFMKSLTAFIGGGVEL